MSIVEAGSIPDALASVQTFAEPEEEWLQSSAILSDYSSPRIAISHLKLSCPQLVNYRDGWFLADAFDPDKADVWFATENADVASVEAMLNHIHIQKYTFGASKHDAPQMTDVEAMSFGHLLAYQWKNWARDIYNLNINVYLCRISDDDPDVQIWFESVGVIS